MAINNSWLPTRNQDLLAMADTWVSTIPTTTPPWGIPPDKALALKTARDAFKTSINAAPSEKSKPFYAEFAAQKKTLISVMRDIKKRYLYIPPMSTFEYSEMLLKQPDTEPTSIGVPTLQPSGDIKSGKNGMIEIISIKPAGGATLTKSEYGISINYGVLGSEQEHGIAKAPANGNGLRSSVFTRKKKYLFNFQNERGKQLFVCMRYENSKGEHGPWGDVISAYIS